MARADCDRHADGGRSTQPGGCTTHGARRPVLVRRRQPLGRQFVFTVPEAAAVGCSLAYAGAQPALQITTASLPRGTRARPTRHRSPLGRWQCDVECERGLASRWTNARSNGVLSGTPGVVGSFRFTVRVDGGGRSASKQLDLVVGEKLTAQVPTAQPYKVGGRCRSRSTRKAALRATAGESPACFAGHAGFMATKATARRASWRPCRRSRGIPNCVHRHRCGWCDCGSEGDADRRAKNPDRDLRRRPRALGQALSARACLARRSRRENLGTRRRLASVRPDTECDHRCRCRQDSEASAGSASLSSSPTYSERRRR